MAKSSKKTEKEQEFFSQGKDGASNDYVNREKDIKKNLAPDGFSRRTVSEVIDVSPGNLISSLCFIQPGLSHDVFFTEDK